MGQCGDKLFKTISAGLNLILLSVRRHSSRWRLNLLILVSLLLIGVAPVLVSASQEAVFQKMFLRSHGTPVTEKMMVDISDATGSYDVWVINGKSDRSSSCSSADIKINNAMVVGPSDLNQQVASIKKLIKLKSRNLLSVTLHGSPGCFVTIKIVGHSDDDHDGEHDETAAVRIDSWSVSPNPFSPNGDGVSDKSALAAVVHVDGNFRKHGYNYYLRSHWDIGNTLLKSDRDITYPEQKDWTVGLDWDGAGYAAGSYPFTFYVELIRRPIERGGGHERDDDDGHYDDGDGHDGHDTGVVRERVLAKTPITSGIIDLSLIKIAISTPADGEITGAPDINVSGTVGDPQALVKVNGIEVTNSGGAFQTRTTLSYGINTITVSATDATSASLSAGVDVVMDNRSPVILTNAVPEFTSGRAIEVTGNVDDLTATTLTIQGKTAAIPAGGGPFSVIADLVEGLNNLFMAATDSAGNASRANLSITSDTIMPVVKITVPASNSYTGKNTIAVSGTIADATATRVTINGVDAEVSVTAFTVPGISVSEGTNTIRATATDASGNVASDQITVISDTVPPSISVDTVPDTTKQRTIDIKGSVADQTATTISIQGKTASIPAGGGAYSISIDLTEGQNTIHISATDSAGNTSSEQRTTILDTMSPAVSISSPLSGSYTNKGSVAVSGSFSDATAVTVTVNGVIAIAANGGFSLPSLSLSEGSNTITATATDAVGNSGSDTVTVVSDTIAPAITIDPTPEYTNQNTIEFKGRVVDQTASTVTIQGKTASIPAGGGPYAIAVVLADGLNNISVQATDSAGNTSEATRTVTADAVAPIVKITSPVAGAYIGAHSTTVTGTVSDSSSIKVMINGVEAAVTGGSFTLQSLSLAEGTNTIRAEATDAAGNKGADEISVISDTTAPVVAITVPADGMMTGSKIQMISGSVVDASPIISATLNDAPLSFGSSTFNQQITLQEGSQTITVKATDKAGNIGTATVTVTLDDIAPAAPVLDPLPGITNLLSITISGNSEPNAKIRISNGTELTVDAVGRFTVPVELTADTTNTFTVRAVDVIGNEGSAATASITQDSIAPYVTGYTLKADPKTTLLIPISMTFSEPVDSATVNSDNITVKGTSVTIDGTFEVTGSEVIFTPVSEIPANQTFILTVSQGIKDKAGNALSPIYSASFNTLRGPAFIVGEVYDDTTGLPLEGAVMRITRINDVVPDPMPSATSDMMGRFSLSYQGVSGVAQIDIGKAGYSRVLRESYLWPNQSMTVFDCRLIQASPRAISAATGGTLGVGDTALWLPAGALTSNADISLTALSQQGIGQRLPLGWSPIYGVDISPSSIVLNIPVQLTIRNIWSLAPGGVAVAYLDEGRRAWVAASGVVTPETITVTVDRLGQYLLILPDSLPAVPPMPSQPGDPILPSTGSPVNSGAAEVKVVPPAVLSREGAHGMTKVIMTTAYPVPSGTAVEARFTEQYTLKEGQLITPETYTQDITMYGAYAAPAPEQPNTLSAEFPTTPSKIYPLGTLYYGKVGVDIFIPSNAGQPADNVIGDSGGTVTAPNGTAIIIPPSSVTSGTVFGVTTLSEQDLPVKGHPSLTLIGALNLQMDGGGFKTGAFPQFIVSGLSAPDGTRVILSRIEMMNGQNGLKAVAIGSVSGGKIAIERCLSGSQCIYNGRYGFHIPSSPIGYLTGTVLKAGVAVPAALVWVDNLPYKALSDANGSFSMVSLAGSFALTAVELSTGQRVSEAGTLAGEETKSILLNLAPYHPIVIAVVPADKTASIDLKAQVKVTFSDAVDPLTVDGNTFRLLQTPALISQPDIVVQGRISLSGKNNEAVFIPDADLKPNATYHVKLAAEIKDMFGNTLVPFESVFTTGNVLGNEALPPGKLKASMPDADGFVTVRGGVALTYGGAVVVVINRTKNIVVTVIADQDGSFMAKIKADLSDEIVVEVKDLLGNTTTLSTGLLQNDDGTAAVGQKGGTIYGPGGITAVVPPGAFGSTIAVQVTMLPYDAIKDVKINPELKSAGVFKIDMGGVTANDELKISIPAPEWITPEHQILLMKVVNVRGYDELTLACPAILKDGKIVSTSPPFPGPRDSGNYTVVSWLDAAAGTAFVMMDTWWTNETNFLTGSSGDVYPVYSGQKKMMVVTVPVNKLYNIVLSNAAGVQEQIICVQGPPERGQFAAGIVRVTDDKTPPTVTNPISDGSEGIDVTTNIILEMSEQVDPATVNSNTVKVKDSKGRIIEGTVYLAQDGRTIVFVPKYVLKLGEKYTISIDGVYDLGGNALNAYTSSFTTFNPPPVDMTTVTLAMAIDRYKNYVVVKGYDPNSLVDMVHSSMIKIFDVTDPEHPQPKGYVNVGGYVQDIKALPDVTINGITGDFVIAVGGRTKTFASAHLINVTDPMKPVEVGFIYLAWNPATSLPPNNVPAAWGEAWEVAVIDTSAYVATYGVGIQAINLQAMMPPYETAQANAIGGSIAESSYKSISKIRTNLVAVKNGTLSVISPQMQILGELSGLNFPNSVTGVAAFPVDIDEDGNLGLNEDNDGDATKKEDETFDLALVSTSDGIVIVDVTDPVSPKQWDLIPLRGGGKIAVDRDRRMAYSVSSGGLSVISLRDLRPPTSQTTMGLRDADNDGVDDRILSVIAAGAGMDIVLSEDIRYAYVADYSGGGLKVIYLGEPPVGVARCFDDKGNIGH